MKKVTEDEKQSFKDAFINVFEKFQRASLRDRAYVVAAIGNANHKKHFTAIGWAGSPENLKLALKHLLQHYPEAFSVLLDVVDETLGTTLPRKQPKADLT